MGNTYLQEFYSFDDYIAEFSETGGAICFEIYKHDSKYNSRYVFGHFAPHIKMSNFKVILHEQMSNILFHEIICKLSKNLSSVSDMQSSRPIYDPDCHTYKKTLERYSNFIVSGKDFSIFKNRIKLHEQYEDIDISSYNLNIILHRYVKANKQFITTINSKLLFSNLKKLGIEI